MDTREAKAQVEKAREVLVSKGAPIEGTAAGHLLLAIESLIENLDNSFGSTRKRPRNGDQYDFREQAYRTSYTEPKDTPFRH